MTADLLGVLLDSWDRNNRVLVNLLGALPPGGLEARALPGHPTVAQMLTHMAAVRLSLIQENAPEAARPVPEQEWAPETDPDVIARSLNGSAAAVREAVRGRTGSGRMLDDRYDHPLLLIRTPIEWLAKPFNPSGREEEQNGLREWSWQLGALPSC
ncbi:DinB family protein [Deinococcus sp. A31D244]|uniref:DinB family protein n=1 Tax=Deinococcus sp. A31D244 TaxID=3397675 RepID=UPI0039E04F99